MLTWSVGISSSPWASRSGREGIPKSAFALAEEFITANLADSGGNLDEVLKFAQITREAAPEDPSVGDTLGWIYYKKWLVDAAYTLIAEAAGKSTVNASIRYNQRMVLAGKRMNKEAAVELKIALSLDPKFPGADDAKKTLENLRQ
jgi:tetratricopeptide (TPR) repeat protein